KEEYIKAVLKAKEYIKKGDIYQVNFSHRFQTQFTGNPFQLYSVLREINPAPFASYLNFGDVNVISSSPERFIKVSGRNVHTRPIKGTMPRGRNAVEDAAFRKKLLESTKDRAENLMIIDLERNDLGRISEYGSIKVSEFMICEEYPTVFQLTSTVEGKLRKNVDPADILVNCFPGGSITGAPKIRSMEIIEELEPVKRGIYTGAIGYLGFNQDMDTSVVIRTIIIKGDNAYFNVGGGIVYDSDPEREYQETLDKARALVRAMEFKNSTLKTNINI
ncbi:MAG: aminodeoxychorismate synthase component I, partial [Candidatus Omnitrophica bacterium]|nr:aminodeoxychorismate synthase component I [Candidatus Omnitrophota bacterium]